ncbi:MAG: hypothetical protein HGB20_03860 [Chlorobiaceae bacterium]|nr:hypothetical protein [Chlorobiaceae bacterium]
MSGKAFSEKITAAEAAARALVDAGVSMVNCVPASGAASIFETWKSLIGKVEPWHYHEEVAMGMAMGASLAGRRSTVVIKAHGFAKAANAVIDALSMGAESGLVIIVAADREGRTSDTVFDTDSFVAGTRLPFRRLAAEEMYHGILEAFDRSESMGLPVVCIVEDDDLPAYVTAPPASSRTIPPVDFPPRDLLRHNLLPVNNLYPHEVLQAKLTGRDWRALPRPVLPSIPEGLPVKFHATVRSCMPVFDILKNMHEEIDFIMGDTGSSALFSCPPYDLVDATAYYGGSIPMAAGALQAGAKKAWAVTGDWSFTAAGHLGIHEAFRRGLPLKVLIFHNGSAVATGGQTLDEGVFERILKGYDDFVSRVDAGDSAKLRDTLYSAQKSDRMEIVVVDIV